VASNDRKRGNTENGLFRSTRIMGIHDMDELRRLCEGQGRSMDLVGWGVAELEGINRLWTSREEWIKWD
jgi:hypothetical protein